MSTTETPIRRGRAFTLSTSGAPVELEISAIRRDGGTQPRAGIDPEHVARLADALEAGEELPAVVVYHDGDAYWLADGYHRLEAHARRGSQGISADVRQGTRRDAVLYSVGANRSHGLPRSREDLRRAIETLLRDEEWGQWSDREIARQVGCSHPHVGTVRRSLVTGGNVTTYTTRKAPDGKRYPAPSRPNDDPPGPPEAELVAAELDDALEELGAVPPASAPPPPPEYAEFVDRAAAAGGTLTRDHDGLYVLAEPGGTTRRYPHWIAVVARVRALETGEGLRELDRAVARAEGEIAGLLAGMPERTAQLLCALWDLEAWDDDPREVLREALTTRARQRGEAVIAWAGRGEG